MENLPLAGRARNSLFVAATALILSACASPYAELYDAATSPRQHSDTAKGNLARKPVGLYIEVFRGGSAEITAVNNSDAHMAALDVQVLFFQKSTQVGEIKVTFRSLEPGHPQVEREYARIAGNSWDNWKYRYEVKK